MHPTPYLFVYGSLLSGFRSPAYEYISRYFDFVSPGRVRGFLYDLGEYPAAIPGSEEQFISGELYKVRNVQELSWALGQLDDYEGVVGEEGQPSLYRRDVAAVFNDETAIDAWVYWYNGDTSNHPLVSTGNVMDYFAWKNRS